MDWGFGGLEGKWETRRTLVLSLCFSIRLKRRVFLGQMGAGTSMFEPVFTKMPFACFKHPFCWHQILKQKFPDGVMQSVGSGRSKWAHQCAEARGTLGQYNSKGFSCQLVPFWSPLLLNSVWTSFVDRPVACNPLCSLVFSLSFPSGFLLGPSKMGWVNCRGQGPITQTWRESQ